MDDVPVVTLHIWRLPPRAVARTLATTRPRPAGASFAKLLGTGSGTTFRARDADLGRWALLACWPDRGAAEAFETSRRTCRLDAAADERWRAVLRPLASRGRWARREPFGRPGPTPWAGPVAAVTRARLDPRRAHRFRRAVPPVAADLERAGLLLRLGVGEAPVGLQGTLSLWASATALTDFAYRSPAHRAVVARTPAEGWYREELFARFAVTSTDGTVDGSDPVRAA